MTRAKHCIDTVRRVVSFGVTLGFEDCMRADTILGKMRFEAPAARIEKLIREQAAAVRTKAHEMRLHSIALATALQFGLAFRQKDVVGEWEPVRLATSAASSTTGDRWVNGEMWTEIDADMILRKVPTKTKERASALNMI